MPQLAGKKVLVTGGSAGLGAAVATKFASEGAHIVVNYATSAERAEGLASRLRDAYGVNCYAIQADVAQAGQCGQLVQKAFESLHGLDIVVSNAGWTRAANWRELDALSEEDWDKTYAMNVKAHMFLFKAAKQLFEANDDGGSFIITTSVAGIKQSGSSLAYSVSKHAAIALARGLALHQGPKCRINTVAPGLIATEWATKQFPKDVMDKIEADTPLRKIANLEDCADAFLLLAASRSITGQTIVVDGGFSLR
ncbi:hypothetical protein PYCC9005_002146 [Savitreella phatthalungensis]